MIDIEKGRYWDEGITLIDGCSPCSPGCDHCWSAAQSHRFNRKQYFTDDNGKFNGDIQIHPKRLSRFNTRKPKVFSIWNDLFWEK
jgi:protein gp37